MNFAMGTLIVGGSASVTFADGFDNDGQGQALCSEALYVKHLILEDGASIALGGVNVYYLTLDDQGGTISEPNCGSLQQVVPAPPAPDGVADCADLDDDLVRDDNCLWWTVDDDGACIAEPLVFADMGGAFGACAPDGTADGNDRFHSLNCFSNSSTTGTPGYPCESAPPQAMNVDAGGSFGQCAADGVCDANDAFHALNAFQSATTCTCSGPIAPMPEMPPGDEVETPRRGSPKPSGSDVVRRDVAIIDLAASAARIQPSQLVDVDVILASAVDDLRGYQLHLGVSGGQRGALELVDILIREPSVLSIQPSRGATNGEQLPSARAARVERRATSDERRAAGDERRWSAFNLRTQQMAAGLDSPGIPAAAGAYLATFTYRASRDAEGTFAIELLAERGNAEHRTFLFSTVLSSSPTVLGPVPVRLQVDPGLASGNSASRVRGSK
jgi:hypothetical protein